MTVSYKLDKNLIGRTAAMMNWKLGQVNSSVRIVNKEENRMINAKSLIGLLSGCFKADNIIDIVIEDERDFKKVKEILDEVGKQI
jgi:phosphotransferase system HPr-like phosphotransfer protein